MFLILIKSNLLIFSLMVSGVFFIPFKKSDYLKVLNLLSYTLEDFSFSFHI